MPNHTLLLLIIDVQTVVVVPECSLHVVEVVEVVEVVDGGVDCSLPNFCWTCQLVYTSLQ